MPCSSSNPSSKKVANIRFAHQLTRRLAAVRMQGIVQGLYPDGNAQAAVAYENSTSIAIATLVVSTHHAPSLSLRGLRYQLIEYVMKPVIPDRLPSPQMMGRVGGPKAGAGLTDRKIVVDTYGGVGRHGGEAFSGKELSKVDRSAAYTACYIDKSVVATEPAGGCEVQIASVIGHVHPVCVRVET